MGPVQFPQGLLGQDLGEVDVLVMPVLEPGHVPDAAGFESLRVLRVHEAVDAKVGAWRSRGVAGDVDVEPETRRVGSTGVVGAQVGLADVDGPIPCAVQQQRQGDILFVQSIHVPVGCLEVGVGPGCVLVAVQRPVGDVGPGGSLSGHEAGAAWGAHGSGGVVAGEDDARVGQSLHGWCAVSLVQFSDGLVHGDRGVLPSQVVHVDEDDVRLGCANGSADQAQQHGNAGDGMGRSTKHGASLRGNPSCVAGIGKGEYVLQGGMGLPWKSLKENADAFDEIDSYRRIPHTGGGRVFHRARDRG